MWLRGRFERSSQTSQAAEWQQSSRAGSASVTPSVILHKGGRVSVPAPDKPKLDTDIAKLELMDCLFGNRKGQRKRDIKQ